MIKQKFNRQIIDLPDYARQHWKIVVITGFGISSLFCGVSTAVVILSGMDYRWALCMSLIAYGVTFIPGGFYVDSRLIFWANSLSVFKQVEQSEEFGIDNTPIKESADLQIEMFSRGSEVPSVVKISEEQLRDIIGIMFYDTYLTRSSLNSDIWPSKTDNWRDGKIQKKIMDLGLINSHNTFTVGEAGEIGRLEVEIKKLTSKLGGVGGSNDDN